MKIRSKSLVGLGFLLLSITAYAKDIVRPNIVFILADDLGLDGVSVSGSDVRKTPNIDKLADMGIRFETCYAAPLCGPSHCLLMTGRYAFRTGGSRVSFIASWPGVTPVGKVSKDIISFADPLVTFVELAGAKLPAGLKFDGRSFAPQLRGEAGNPRAWAYVQLGNKWFVREPGYKMNESGELFDMSDAPS